MKPITVFLRLAVVLLILGIIVLCFPKEGLDISGFNLRMPSMEDIFLSKQPEYADVDKILVDNTSDTTGKKQDDGIVGFEYGSEAKEQLDSFFLALDSLKQTDNTSIRILHYGDSQIEGDRISGYLRKKLQKTFGGHGQGEIPMYSLSQIKGVIYNYSSDWEFHSIIQPQAGYNRYGTMMSSIKALADSAITELNFASPTDCELTIYFSSPDKESRLKISDRQKDFLEITIPQTASLRQESIRLTAQSRYLRIEADAGTELYGMDLSDGNGLYLDNISLRGSSGWGIRQCNKTILETMANDLHVRLVIMQFGVNAIPQKENKIIKDYTFYKTEFAKQLKYLHATLPDAAIIVVGVSDRSIRQGDNYITNPNVFKLRQAQKEAALENDCIFWDLFEAMGGENSMPAWVLRDEPLANKDFIHFNNKGAEYVATMFLNALRKEYNASRQRNQSNR